ncbi:MAG: hypothetical protein VXA43_03340 [Candidatus Poseidoniales archaeon]
MRKQEKLGYGLVALSLVLVVLGSIGFTMTGEINDLPTPNTPGKTFFGDDPIPENGLSTFITAELTLTWDRDDIYVVIVDEDEKKSCESPPPGLFNEGSTTACTPYDADVLAAGNNGDEGLVWDVQPGVHYAGIGSVEDRLPAGTQVNMSYAVHLQAGFVSYFLFALVGVGGLAYTRVE